MIRPGTIAAIASPRGPAGRGVIRVSGPRAWEVVAATWTGDAPLPEQTRGFSRGHFDDGVGRQPLLLLWMPGPRSFTREDVAEFHLPGSPPLLEAALLRILSLDVRPAEAGEFTRRAFENGRIDLTRAEGILELTRARNESERRSASALMLGGLARRLAPLRSDLESMRCLVEASLDFDEEDTGHVPVPELEQLAGQLLAGLREAGSWEARRVHASDLPRVVLQGAPNAGKSSLFNQLLGEGAAIVSELRGTTRDVLAGNWETGAGEVQLVDTAGLEQGLSGPDGEAQVHGRRWQQSADLLLWLVDAQTPVAALAEDLRAHPATAPRLLIWSKLDLLRGDLPDLPLDDLGLAGSLEISVHSGQGLEAVARAVAELCWPATSAPGTLEEGPTRLEREIGIRHQAALRGAAEGLQGGLEAWRGGLPLDLFAESLRGVGGELDGIGGRTTPEDLLSRIFASFCIGK